MEDVETRLANVTLIRFENSDITERIRNAVAKYGQEGVDWYRGFLETPVGAEYPPTVPFY
jgi:hypothetical protein